MMRDKLFIWGMVLTLAGGLAGCNRTDKNGNLQVDDTPTTGQLPISVDETFAPVLTAEVDTFQKLYRYAKVTAEYAPEEDVMRDLLNGKARVVVLSRELNATERAAFEKEKIVPRTVRVGTDGLAIIVNPANPDSLFTISQLRDIFTGKTTRWQQLTSTSQLGDINVVFDASRSSTTRYVQDSIARGTPLTSRVFATKSNPALIDYVATHPNAIGVIGANWISDRDDKAVETFLGKVRVAGVAAGAGAKPDDYRQPYQAYLALKTYPLHRSLYMISREARTGLGTGFVQFVAGPQGQLIILKSGLLPATGQARIVNNAAN